MKKNSFLWAALSMTAALVMTACSNDDNANESPVQQSTVKTIPYTVTVNGGEGGATTRATVESDNKSLKFAVGDKLYISGTDIHGVLDIQSGTGTTFATFSGDLTYSGSGTPAWDLSLTATLVSAQQNVGTEVSVDAAGAVTVNYPTNAYCSSVNDAVQKYSNLTGTSYYGLKSFALTQQTAFLNFVITFEDGTTTGTELSAVVSNNNEAICTANVTTTTESEKVVAKFVLPVAKGTTLSSANVKFGDKAAISFGASQTLDGKVYNVRKTQAAALTYPIALSAVTSDYVGSVVTTDGNVYATVAAASAASKTAVAVIAYVGTAGSVDASSGTYKGLAVALSDANSGSNCKWAESYENCLSSTQTSDIVTALGFKNGITCTSTLTGDGHTHAAATAAASNNGTTAPTGTSGWFMPSMGQWNLIVQGLATKKAGSAVTTDLIYFSGNPTYKADNLNSVITDAGGTGFQKSFYWASTEKTHVGAWAIYFGDGYAIQYAKDTNRYVRSIIAF